MDWKNDFLELLFPSDEKPRNVSAADELKFKNRPNSLFKYRRASETLFSSYLEEIKNDVIWLSRPDQFNDPYECFFKGDFQKTMVGFLSRRYPEMKKVVTEIFPDGQFGEKPAEKLFQYFLAKRGTFSKENLEALHGLLQSTNFDSNKKFMNDTIKIGCFSERNDSIPMWAHYADKHTGFCLEYDVYTQPMEIISYLFPVIYSDEIVDVTKELFEGTEGWGIKPTIFKSNDWSYEREWRFIRATPLTDLKGVNIKFFPIKGIYLGTDISPENKTALCDIAKSKNIPVHKMRLSNSRFAFESYSL